MFYYHDSGASRILAAVFTVLLTALFSCGTKEGTAPAQDGGAQKKDSAKTEPAGEAKTEGQDSHDHGHEGEGGGHNDWTIDIGEHEFLGTMCYEADEGTVRLEVLSHEDGKPYPHKALKPTLNLMLGESPVQFAMGAESPDAGGKAQAYSITDAKLRNLKGLKGRINIEIDGKQYIADLEAKH